MNYTRKRALLACDFCRHRKRRCDGEQPCSTCRDAQADCVYKELPTDRVEPSSSSQGAVAERLSRIEALLEEQGHRLSEALTSPSSLPWPYLRSSPRTSAASPASVSNRSTEGRDLGPETQFLIPTGHSATLTWLLSVPPVRAVIRELPSSYFYELEEDTALPPALDIMQPGQIPWPSLEPDRLRGFADAYFEQVPAHLALLTRSHFEMLQVEVLRTGLSQDIETAICLCVWALGSIESSSGVATVPEPSTDPIQDLGISLFAIALRIILSKTVWSFRASLHTCQALVLAGLYLSYLGRPLHAWKMMHQAGQRLVEIINIWSRSGDLEYFDEDHVRLFWCCFIEECDFAAELDVTRTGLEPFGDKMRLPRSTDISESENLIYWTAEMAMSRLMNRIVGSLYSPDNIGIALLAESGQTPNNASINQLVALSSELNRQLEQYCSTIPVQPPLTVDPMSNGKRRRLNLRSLYARQLIHRPFVLYVALQSAPQASPLVAQASSSRSPTPQQSPYAMPRIVLEKCSVCTQSCEAYIRTAVDDVLDRRSPDLWTVAQRSVASFVVLFLASRSPHLRHLAPDLDALASALVPRLREWATPGLLFEALGRVVDTLLASRYH